MTWYEFNSRSTNCSFWIAEKSGFVDSILEIWSDERNIWRFFPSSLSRQNSSINLISVFLITRQWLDMSYSGLWVLKNCRLRSFKILFASESFSFFTALKRPSKDTSFFGHFSIVYYRLWLWLQGFPYDKLFLGKKVIN